MTQYAMVKAGLQAADAAFIGVGTGAAAVAAMKKGDIDAMANLDPVISKLESDGDAVALIDTRTEAGTKALFGGTNPAACLYAKGEFIDKNPETCQRLVNAFKKALTWMAAAKADEIAGSVPEEYFLGDKGVYIKSLEAVRAAYSQSGVISEDGHKSIMDMLVKLDKELAGASIPRAKTFVDGFVAKAK